MTTFSLFCPHCDALLVELAPGAGRALPICPACGWVRPAGEIREGTPAGEPIALPGWPRRGCRPVVAGGRLWLPLTINDDDEGECGAIAGISLEAGSSVPPVLLPLGADTAVDDLATDGRRLFYAPYDVDVPAPRTDLVAYDSGTAQEAWRHTVTAGRLTAPVYHQGRLYLAAEKELQTLDAESGGVLWSAAAPTNVRLQPVLAAEAGALLLIGLQSEGFPLRAVSLADGGTLSTAEHELGFRRSPCAVGETIYAVAGLSPRAALLALDIASGEQTWDQVYVPPRRTSRGPITSPPTVAGDVVTIGGGSYTADGGTGHALFALDNQSGQLRWSVPTAAHVYVPTAAAASLLLVVDNSGLLLVLDAADGRERWRARLGAGGASVPLFHDERVFVADRRGALHAYYFRQAEAPPDETAAAYLARGEVEMAAAAFALSGDLPTAGSVLLEANQAKHALVLFRLAEDRRGELDCLEHLGRWDDVITIVSQEDDQPALARALRLAGRPRQAAQVYAALEQWSDAIECYLEADGIDDLLAAADLAGRCLKVPQRAVPCYRLAGQRLATAGNWQRAWEPLRRSGEGTAADEAFARALAYCHEERLDVPAADLLRQRAQVEVDMLGERRAIGRVEIAHWLEEAARWYVQAGDTGSAHECELWAAQLMETPRFRLQVSAAEGSTLVEGRATPLVVRVENVGFGAAAAVVVKLGGDMETASSHEFGVIAKEQEAIWDTARIVPNQHGDGVLLEVVLTYRSMRLGEEGSVRIPRLLSVADSGLLGWVKKAPDAHVSLNIDTYVASGATNNELKIVDSAVVARGGITMGGGEGSANCLSASDSLLTARDGITMEGSQNQMDVDSAAVIARGGINLRHGAAAGTPPTQVSYHAEIHGSGAVAQGPGVVSAAQGMEAAEGQAYCTACGQPHAPGLRQCPACGVALCPACGSQVGAEDGFCSHCRAKR
jgi:outer membrane protein assembly factor BamB